MRSNLGPVCLHYAQSLQHAADHGPMPAAVYIQKMVGLAHAQVIKEHIGHAGNEVLARVDQDLFQLARLPESMRNHAGFDELRACAQNCKNFFI